MRLSLVAVFLSACVLPCWGQHRPVLQQAIQQIEERNFEKAEVALREHIQLHASDALAHYLLGAALNGQGKRQESQEYLLRTLQLDKKLTLALRFLGINAFESGDPEAARKYLQRYVRDAPRDEIANVILAQVALAGGEFSLAIMHFRESQRLVQKDVNLQLLLAKALISAQQIQEGLRITAGIRSRDPAVLYSVGLLFASAKHHREAIEIFNAIRSTYPEPSAVEFNLALAYSETGNVKAEIRLLNEMIQANRGNADVYSLLGDAYLRQGKPEEARKSLQTAVSLAPEQARRYVELLALHLLLGQIQPGLDFANLALQKHPDNYELFALRAALYSLDNRIHLAEADYRKALQLSPTTEWLYTSLASLLAFEDDRLEEAKNLLESHLGQFTVYYSFYVYSEVLRHMGLYGFAQFRETLLPLLEKAARLNPNFAPTRLNLGRLHAARQDWSQAISELQAAASADPGDKASRYELYQIFVRIGQGEKAGEMLAALRKIREKESGRTSLDNLKEMIPALKRVSGGARGN